MRSGRLHSMRRQEARPAAGSAASETVSAAPAVVAAGSVALSLPAASPSVDPPHAAAATSAATASRPRKRPRFCDSLAGCDFTGGQTSRRRNHGATVRGISAPLAETSTNATAAGTAQVRKNVDHRPGPQDVDECDGRRHSAALSRPR